MTLSAMKLRLIPKHPLVSFTKPPSSLLENTPPAITTARLSSKNRYAFITLCTLWILGVNGASGAITPWAPFRMFIILVIRGIHWVGKQPVRGDLVQSLNF
ncbi:hypothetical protein VTI28DRAFT_4430 [Corynascus sepedonium]